jgi:hypothetical protein
MAGPVLTSASISFSTQDPTTSNHNPNQTGGPNKDFNTNISVSVIDNSGTIVAHLSSTEGNFPYPSNEGPFQLALTETTALKSSLVGAPVRIHIDPVGNDDWSFNAFAEAQFSDGSALTGQVDGIQLGDSQEDVDMVLG